MVDTLEFSVSRNASIIINVKHSFNYCTKTAVDGAVY